LTDNVLNSPNAQAYKVYIWQCIYK